MLKVKLQVVLLLLVLGLKSFGQQEVNLRAGIPHAFKKIKVGDTLRVVYLGGSITQATGYRLKSARWLQSRYPKIHIETFNAGVGGTGSDLGLFRLKDDVLAHHPDLVFIEFAVNDQAADSVKVVTAVERIIRQLYSSDPRTSICFLYTVSEPMLADYGAKRLPASVAAMERLAAHYRLPSVNFAPAVLSALGSGRLIFKGNPADTVPGKLVFSADGTHPLDAGHELYTGFFEKAWRQLELLKEAPVRSVKPLTAFLRHTSRHDPGTFATAGWKKVLPGDPQGNFICDFPGLLYSEHDQDSLVIDFKGTMLGLEDVIGPASNGFSVSIDGKKSFKITRFDKYCSSYRRHYVLIDLEKGNHHVVIKPDFGPIDKFNILKPENRAGIADGRYNQNKMFVGKILIGGTLISK